MKRDLKKTMLILGLTVLCSVGAFAQFSVGLQGGMGIPVRDNSKKVASAGVNFRVFASPHLAIGAAAKIYEDASTNGTGASQYKTVGGVMPLTGTLDYYLTTGAIRPYIGGDAGVYLSRYKINYNDKTIYKSNRYSNFGVAPRAGLIFALGKDVGLQVEGIYHYVFNNKNRRMTTGELGNIDFRTTSKFYGFNIGLIIGLGRGSK